MADLLLGVDVGTYSSKGVLTTLEGVIIKTLTVPHDISMPHPGHVEQDADLVWWSDTLEIIRGLLRGLEGTTFKASDVRGVALSAIGPCLLPLDAAGSPLRPGILYGVDTRAELEIAELEARYGAARIFEHANMALTSQAIGPKLRWLEKHESEVFMRASMFTTASSYLSFKLTRRHIMDHHTASHYMPLYDPRAHAWDPEFCAALGVQGRLPELGWSDEIAGYLTLEAAQLSGLPGGIPVAVGAVDALSEALSVGVQKAGDLMVMYGSTTFFILVQDQPTPDPRVWSVGGAFSGQTNLAAGMSTTGSLTRWFRDELAPDLPEETAYRTLFEGAAQVPPGSRGLLVLPYFSGERTPIQDAQARGVIAGLSLSHTRADLYRAVLEGVGYGVRHNLETFAAMGSQIRRVVAVGGGAQHAFWPQMISDISGVAQVLPETTLGACYGDAFLAGLAAGLLEKSDLKNWVREKKPCSSLEVRFRLSTSASTHSTKSFIPILEHWFTSWGRWVDARESVAYCSFFSI